MKNIKSILLIFLFMTVPVALVAQEIYSVTEEDDSVNIVSVTKASPAISVSAIEVEGSEDADDSLNDDGAVHVSPGNKGIVSDTDPAVVTDKKVVPGVISEDSSGVSEDPTAITGNSDSKNKAEPVTTDQDGKGYVADDFEISPNKQIQSTVEFNTEAVFKEKEVLDPNKIYIKTNKEITPEIQSAIYDLRVKPSKVFSPVLSETSNLVVDPTVEDKKVIYHLELPVNTSIYKEGEVIKPVFDLRIEQPVEFKLHDKEIIVNDEQVIKYEEIMSEISDAEVVPPLVQFELHSAVTDGKVYDASFTPEANFGIFTFVYNDQEVNMPIHSDFKVENKKLYLQSDDKVYDLKVLPQEIYSGVNDLVVKEPEIVIKEFSLKVKDDEPIYDLVVKEPFKLLWLFSTKIKSSYTIDPDDGSVIKKKRSWYGFLGKTDGDDDDIVFLRPE